MTILNIRPTQRYQQEDTIPDPIGVKDGDPKVGTAILAPCQIELIEAGLFKRSPRIYLPLNAVCEQGINVYFTPTNTHLNTGGLRKLVIALNNADSCGETLGKVILVGILFFSGFGWIFLGLWIRETLSMHNEYRQEQETFTNTIRNELDRRIEAGRKLYIYTGNYWDRYIAGIDKYLNHHADKYDWLKEPPAYLQHLVE